ncbi:hypothetical protein [Parasitella parasitica]|uniref:Uncharacterized protein n=1 Tax=Parasitella parasitica TaxID=35722 RepID=A0A0B7N2M7_9FUNG|nr:hypothetical protein [Parasitella parasitica]
MTGTDVNAHAIIIVQFCPEGQCRGKAQLETPRKQEMMALAMHVALNGRKLGVSPNQFVRARQDLRRDVHNDILTRLHYGESTFCRQQQTS